jgi:glycerate 2-kinase
MTPGSPGWMTALAVGAVRSLDPAALVAEALTGWQPTHADVLVLAVGKAAEGMARGAVAAIELPVRGAVVARGTVHVGSLESWVGGHPYPTDGSVRAGDRLMALARTAGPGTSVVVLLSGGASAMCEVPIPGISLGDVDDLTRRLLRSGAPIEDVNRVRCALSAFKGGGLGGALGGAGEVVVLAISDVVGSDPSVIGSGPTVPRRRDAEGVVEVARRHGVTVSRRVRAAMADRPAVPTRWYPVEVIADGSTLAAAVLDRAGEGSRRGFDLVGSASATAAAVVAAAEPGLTVHVGETTVAVSGEQPGGRNQEAALAAARALPMSAASVFLAMGSDGVDGTTDAAGAVVDDDTWALAEERGLDPAGGLAGHDAHRVLDGVDALMRTGPTGTNVADLWLVWRPID